MADSSDSLEDHEICCLWEKWTNEEDLKSAMSVYIKDMIRQNKAVERLKGNELGGDLLALWVAKEESNRVAGESPAAWAARISRAVIEADGSQEQARLIPFGVLVQLGGEEELKYLADDVVSMRAWLCTSRVTPSYDRFNLLVAAEQRVFNSDDPHPIYVRAIKDLELVLEGFPPTTPYADYFKKITEAVQETPAPAGVDQEKFHTLLRCAVMNGLSGLDNGLKACKLHLIARSLLCLV